jgi:glutamate formiminotransferase
MNSVTRSLIECVPNFSEGRDAAKLDAIAQAILAVPGVAILDRHIDADHNRSVITMAGAPAAVAEAAILAVGKAVELIDLNAQTGVHPRIGAADVVPFVPVDGITLEECARIAEQVGEQIWQRFGVPVYLYQASARHPRNLDLENIRRGQFEGLSVAVQIDPERRPDFGEAMLHPTAGATVVGARKFLIAYNINLDTADIEVAKRIARQIRFSSGGLPFVKALGVLLKSRNLAQVTMNLTDFEVTPIHVVFDAVAKAAGEFGVGIVGSEIIGLVPARALEMAAAHYLKIEGFQRSMILENCLKVE